MHWQADRTLECWNQFILI